MSRTLEAFENICEKNHKCVADYIYDKNLVSSGLERLDSYEAKYAAEEHRIRRRLDEIEEKLKDDTINSIEEDWLMEEKDNLENQLELIQNIFSLSK